MASFTQKAIKEAFLEILNEKPLAHITVKDIVERCGVNRNTFYYHYEDLPALLQSILKEDVERVINATQNTKSAEDYLRSAIKLITENKKAVRHIYDSSSREIFEKYLDLLCRYVVESYMDKTVPKGLLPESDRRLLIKFYKCECVGQLLDWAASDMDYDLEAECLRLLTLFRGATETAIIRSKETTH